MEDHFSVFSPGQLSCDQNAARCGESRVGFEPQTPRLLVMHAKHKGYPIRHQ